MTSNNGAGAASAEASARLEVCQLGGDGHQDKPHPNNSQFKSSRADFARELTAALGPRLAQPGWVRFSIGEAAR